MRLAIGVILLAVTAALAFIGFPKRNGDRPRFLQFEAAVVLYPPLIMITVMIFAVPITPDYPVFDNRS